MMLPLRTHASTVLSAVLVGLATLASAHSAHASTSYPPEVQKALSKQFGKDYCVPQCTLCHQTNVGGIGTLNKFGLSLRAGGSLGPLAPALVQPAFEKYFMTMPNADSDLDGMSDLKELEIGSSPSVALPRGAGEVCPDITYGCGARVAAAPPPIDRVGLLSAGLAVLGLAALRRRQRQSG